MKPRCRALVPDGSPVGLSGPLDRKVCRGRVTEDGWSTAPQRSARKRRMVAVSPSPQPAEPAERCAECARELGEQRLGTGKHADGLFCSLECLAIFHRTELVARNAKARARWN